MLFRSLRYSKKVLCQHIAIVRNVRNKSHILSCQHFLRLSKMLKGVEEEIVLSSHSHT